MKRRDFLQKSIAASTCALLPHQVFGFGTKETQPHLIYIFLQGAADSLAFLPPVEDPAYQPLRPVLNLSSRVDRNHKVGSPFFLHPRAKSLYPLWKNGELTFVLQTGLGVHNASHPLAENEIQRGAPGNTGVTDGFLFRALNEMRLDEGIRAIALQNVVPTSLFGRGPGILCFDKLSSFSFDPFLDTHSIRSLYAKDAKSLGAIALNSSFSAIKQLEPARRASGFGGFREKFPKDFFGRRMCEISWLIKHRIGVPIYTTSLPGWDTHARQGAESGTNAQLIEQLSDGIAAMRENLGADWGRTLVVVMTEFGRTVAENGSQGTDHGYGAFALLAGGGLRGGRLYGQWKELKKENLHSERYLPITTDYRQILAECFASHFKITDPGAMARIFPGFDYRSEKNLKFLV